MTRKKDSSFDVRLNFLDKMLLLTMMFFLGACGGEDKSSSSSSGLLGSSGGGLLQPIRYDNPFESAKKWYVNQEWSALVRDHGGASIADFNTGIWLDRISAIEPYEGQSPNNHFGLEEHLDEALLQDADLFQLVLYNLPGRNCTSQNSSGELPANEKGMEIYKREYIDRIVRILGDDKYKDIRIVAILEMDSWPNLITHAYSPACAAVNNDKPWGYTEGIRYALQKLSVLPNVYTYIDVAHSGKLGKKDDFQKATEFLADIVAGRHHAGPTAAPGWQAVAGFISNVANYVPLDEPYVDPERIVGSFAEPMRMSSFYQNTLIVNEHIYGNRWIAAQRALGAPERLGMLVDTSRNGWGGHERPSRLAPGATATDIVNGSKIDRRVHRGNWCNQDSGVGERPRANPRANFHAYVWTKPLGESDGISYDTAPRDANDVAKKHDPMCHPNGVYYEKDSISGNTIAVRTGALPDAPHAGRWHALAFRKLLENAYPPVFDY